MGSDNDNDEDSEVESSIKDEHELSIDSLALKSQGPSSPSSPASCGFIPSISQVWSSPTSSPDNGPPPEFRDWHPTSQISQFLNDLNYVPMHLAPLDVLEYHGKEDIERERVEGGEQCQLEDLDEEFVCKVSFPIPDPSQELSDGPVQSTALPHSPSLSPSSFQHPSHLRVTLQARERARKKALQVSKEINLLSSLRAGLMRKHRRLVMISHLDDSELD